MANLSENLEKNRYLDIARELKKSRNMNLAEILIMICAHGTTLEGLVREVEELKNGGETIQTTALFWLTTILRRAQKTWRDLLALILQGKTISWRC